MSSTRLIDHTIDHLSCHSNYDDNIKKLIAQFVIPKYIDMEQYTIYDSYQHLIPSRISTVSLPQVLRNIVRHYREELKYTSVRSSSVFAVSSAYLQYIGENQELDDYDFNYAQGRGGVVGFRNDVDGFKCITVREIISQLVGDDWLE
jgi:hypothetical protein